ncbi:MAG TPA: hypothetical protein DDY39_02115 [Nitrospira sp.]|nr:hypothetical protein [Nitrospira sp.]HBR48451.1 hypothetical protein [Nitrospira sp.]
MIQSLADPISMISMLPKMNTSSLHEGNSQEPSNKSFVTLISRHTHQTALDAPLLPPDDTGLWAEFVVSIDRFHARAKGFIFY